MPKVIEDMTALTRAIEELWRSIKPASADVVYDGLYGLYRLDPEVTEELVSMALYELVKKIGDNLDDMGPLYATSTTWGRSMRRWPAAQRHWPSSDN